ncbi:hypothetical protein, partial [Intrasporangium oryzae]|uniref:hypothetical protein n=1 Tax=Intrasporangium oryzae TaxID=412687 RepID=UPI001B7FE7A5
MEVVEAVVVTALDVVAVRCATRAPDTVVLPLTPMPSTSEDDGAAALPVAGKASLPVAGGPCHGAYLPRVVETGGVICAAIRSRA